MHLVGCLQIVLVALETKPVRVGPQRAGLDAEQHVVGIVLRPTGVVGVVGGEQGRPGPGGDLEQVGHDRFLRGQPVILDLDEEVVSPEDVLEPAGSSDGGVEVPHLALVPLFAHGVGSEELGHHPPETP